MMSRVKGLKLLSATGVAMALFFFAALGADYTPRAGVAETFWNLWVWPRLARLLTALAVVLAGLVSGCLLRRQRPERLAAVVGGIGGLLALVLPAVLEHGDGTIVGPLRNLVQLWWSWGLPLAVACWLGASYWRSDTRRDFWAGPSGAIIRGGVVAGLLVLPLRVPLRWYHHSLVSRWAAAHFPSAPSYHWSAEVVWIVVGGLSAIAAAAVITALLVSWRPTPWSGAFAGSGITAGLHGIYFAGLLSVGSLAPAELREALLRILLLDVAIYVVMGAIAGSFAGRWEVEPGTEPPPD
ncbi:hypothetical protein AMK68_01775 [candidate division KD3-62 bacterium DG_56]|uniref:Uncharacterized protein n=1 Tax=candidate division KD3-62 bacterium DG_56 TaxID=1704032 RepID=A0A0S7XQ94_9BACT|nr:MAG: hypothetical protein AMK68_01775 [candidate division KD3-62 bacterium DG_56]